VQKEDLKIMLDVNIDGKLVTQELTSSFNKTLQYYQGMKGVTVRATYTGESGIVFPAAIDTEDKYIVATVDTIQKPLWARSVTDTFYNNYCILPLHIQDMLHTPYTGHDWGLIQQCILTDRSIQLIDSLLLSSTTTTIDIQLGYDVTMLDSNTYTMIGLLNTVHKLAKVVKITDKEQRIFYTYEDYYNANFTPAELLPPLLTDD